MIKLIIGVLLVILLLFAFMKAPKSTIKFITESGKALVNFLKVMYEEGKPLITELARTPKNETKTENLK